METPTTPPLSTKTGSLAIITKGEIKVIIKGGKNSKQSSCYYTNHINTATL